MYSGRLRRVHLHGCIGELDQHRHRKRSARRSRSRLHRVSIRGDDDRGRTYLGYHVLHYDACSRNGYEIFIQQNYILESLLINSILGTIMAAIQTLITTLEDFFPFLKKTARIKAITLAVVCTIFFLIG